MSGPRLLALDTSTEACSAALLWADGELRQRCELMERGHAERILGMVDDLLVEAGCRLVDLDGLAFGRGPGGFTGLRIAAGVAQGLAYGAGLRVVPVSSLAAVAWQVHATATPAGQGGVLVCNDARMNELYWGSFDFAAAEPCLPVLLSPEAVGPPERVVAASGVTACAGNGLPRHPELAARLQAAGLIHVPDLYPRADAIARIGACLLQRGESVAAADALPVYVRDDVARPPAGAVTGMS